MNQVQSRVCLSAVMAVAMTGLLVATAGCGQETSISEARPELDVDPRELRFGSVTLGETNEDSFLIENRGTGTLEVRGLQLLGQTTSIFQVQINGLPSTTDFDIVSGTAVEVFVGFSPVEVRDYLGYIFFDTNDDNEPQAVIELSGQGDGQLPTETPPPASATPTEASPTATATRPPATESPTPTQLPETPTTAEGTPTTPEPTATAPEPTPTPTRPDHTPTLGDDRDGDGVTVGEGDCDDTSVLVYPGAPEGVDLDGDGTLEGDRRDNDCDGVADEGTDLFDDDGDGLTEDQGDCDDLDPTVRPGKAEGVDADGDGLLNGDGVDNNCDGRVDEGTDSYDDDGDGLSELLGDCDDTNSSIAPGAAEGPDENGDGTLEGDRRDNDCEGFVDEGTNRVDDDGDGYTELAGDCNDLDPLVSPAGVEGATGDSLDDDCDGKVDEGTDLYDDDGDGYSEADGDCDDSRFSTHPGAAEGTGPGADGVPDGDTVDNDCDGTVDEGTDRFDDDGDGTTELEGDCDDDDVQIFPGAPEGADTNADGVLEGDGVDNSCDGIIDEGTDRYDDDRDGHTELQGDCDDADPDKHPGALEGVDLNADGVLDPDGVDDDCDSLIDEGTSGFDDDGDGYTEQQGDCDDDDAGFNPGRLDLPDDSALDLNCDGLDGEIAGAIFLAATGNDGNPGTMGLPKQTFSGALSSARSEGKDIYVAAGTYTANLVIQNSVDVYGGFEIVGGSWRRNIAATARVTGVAGSSSPGATHVTVGIAPFPSGQLDVHLEGLVIQAAPGNSSTSAAGGSSIAVRAIYTDLTLKRVQIVAASGGDGGIGGTGATGAGGADGVDGADGVENDPDKGAAYNCKANARPGQTAGGTGGVGANGGYGGRGSLNLNTGEHGQKGVNGPTCNGFTPQGGAKGLGGENLYPTAFYAETGGRGGNGDPGVQNVDGGPAGDFGAVTSSGYSPARGSTGAVGCAGAGGGGGGGGGGGDNICFSYGGAGGGGGEGGAGGAGGGGGYGGGASIGVFAYRSNVALLLSSVTAGVGGDGGNGGSGGAGGPPGTGGPGGDREDDSGYGGRGGDGGKGGKGGGGGGGGGGPSIAVFYDANGQLVIDNASTTLAGQGGAGGASPTGVRAATGLSEDVYTLAVP